MDEELDTCIIGNITKLNFEPLDDKYCSAKFCGVAVFYVALVSIASLILLTDIMWLFMTVEGIIIGLAIVNLLIIPKACRFKGYALGNDNITYRTGIIFPKTTTIPYSKIQQVSIKQNPITRIYHLYSVEIVNGAQQLSTLSIPGLTQDTADNIKNIVTDKITNCHD